ncbi:hypothetical protein PR202_ga18709 [Eleusine coracana subsp. coracana]|uniref:PDZ domain-containing protein n=1 Tax=Eleusine coracana subsp. coracana TaxID=191504 RepID=A0AAV5CSI4_ELECO|nr:hypothetical protein PR202_ga18709 [Eleusine coracana subsp. coracana]
MHGLLLKTFALLNVALQEELCRDRGIDGGFMVHSVQDDSIADSLGILEGEVIVSVDERTDLTLPQLKDYLISLGWACLNNSTSMEDYDLISERKRSITLPPVGLYDVDV